MIKTQGKSYVTCKCLCEIFVLFHGGIALYTASLCFHYFRRFISILVHVCIYIYIMDIWLRIRRYLLYLNTVIVQSLFIVLQMKWCKQVFPDPLPIVCDLIKETLESLDPPLHSCINLYTQHRDTLTGLIELKQVSTRL